MTESLHGGLSEEELRTIIERTERRNQFKVGQLVFYVETARPMWNFICITALGQLEVTDIYYLGDEFIYRTSNGSRHKEYHLFDSFAGAVEEVVGYAGVLGRQSNVL